MDFFSEIQVTTLDPFNSFANRYEQFMPVL